jgi:succinyl-CoA synthetase alpha subunit
MAILVGRHDRIIVQGITGRTGRNAALRMLEYGTPIVGGVTPGKGGQRVAGLPVYGTVREAVRDLGATASFVAVPPASVKSACLEAIDAGVRTVVVYTERVPVHDAMAVRALARSRGTLVLGPNSAGCVTPGQANLSDLHDDNLRPGRVGVVSKSGTLAYEVVDGLNARGLGQSTVVCLGGDAILCTRYDEILHRFEADPETDIVVLLGEVGGTAELAAADTIRQMQTPVVAYVAGRWAPEGKRMGHAGAIVEGHQGTAAAKAAALGEAGAVVVDLVTQVAPAVAGLMQSG